MAFNKAVRNRNQLVRFENVSAQGEVAAADSADAAVVTLTNAKFALVVRRIVCNVYTPAAQTVTFQSDGSGGDPVFTFEPGTVAGAYFINFGELGYQLPAGEGLEIHLAAAGNGFTYVAEVYKIPVATMTPAQMGA